MSWEVKPDGEPVEYTTEYLVSNILEWDDEYDIIELLNEIIEQDFRHAEDYLKALDEWLPKTKEVWGV